MTDAMNPRDIRALGNAVESEMPQKVTLVYVDYRDEFNSDQIAAIVRGDLDSLYESVESWESDAQWEGAVYHVDELARDIIGRWEREDGEDYFIGVDSLYDEWLSSEERDRALDEIRGRDDSDIFAGLARNSGTVLLRMPIDELDEDHSMDELDSSEFLSRLGFAETENNVRQANELLAETEYPGAVRIGMAIFAAHVSDVYALPFDGNARVKVTNPHIYFGNPFAGSGYVAGPFDGEFTFARGELRTDKEQWGYGWDEIAGVIVSAYECDISVIDNGEEKGNE